MYYKIMFIDSFYISFFAFYINAHVKLYNQNSVIQMGSNIYSTM